MEENNNPAFEDIAKCADDMQEILIRYIKPKNMEYNFKFSCMTLSSLMAGIVHALIDKNMPDQMKMLLEDILKASSLLIDSKMLIKEYNPGDKH